jgi:hypothetical protein
VAGSVNVSKTVNLIARFAEIVARLENGKITLYGKDAQGTLTLLGADQTASYAVTGAEYGNLVAADGTFTAGNKEGPYLVTATAVIDGLTYTATSDVNVNTGAPTISAKVNGQSLLSNMTIASKPQLDIDLVDGNGVKAVRVFIDGVAVQGLSVNAANIGAATLTASFKAERALAAGSHTIVIEADDNLGTTARLTASGLKVYSDLTIQGRPMNYPNPFKPASEATKINYQLSKDADVKLMIYDLSGRLVYSQVYSAGSEGGKAGENNPAWDGKNFTGIYVGNGVYVYYLTAGGRPLGSGELSVYQ